MELSLLILIAIFVIFDKADAWKVVSFFTSWPFMLTALAAGLIALFR